MKILAVLAIPLLLASCGSSSGVDGDDSLSKHVANNQIGRDADQWIEMFNDAGGWERTGLIFGYVNDNEECQKAIEGLKRVNFAREYRCVPAN